MLRAGFVRARQVSHRLVRTGTQMELEWEKEAASVYPMPVVRRLLVGVFTNGTRWQYTNLDEGGARFFNMDSGRPGRLEDIGEEVHTPADVALLSRMLAGEQEEVEVT